MTSTYRDSWIECTAEEIRIRGYYFPWGTKRIRFSEVRGVRRVRMDALRGRYRLWGTARLSYWASLDPARPAKSEALILDVGRRVRPFLTPDDPDAVARVILTHARLDRIEEGDRGPFL